MKAERRSVSALFSVEMYLTQRVLVKTPHRLVGVTLIHLIEELMEITGREKGGEGRARLGT